MARNRPGTRSRRRIYVSHPCWRPRLHRAPLCPRRSVLSLPMSLARTCRARSSNTSNRARATRRKVGDQCNDQSRSNRRDKDGTRRREAKKWMVWFLIVLVLRREREGGGFDWATRTRCGLSLIRCHCVFGGKRRRLVVTIGFRTSAYNAFSTRTQLKLDKCATYGREPR